MISLKRSTIVSCLLLTTLLLNRSIYAQTTGQRGLQRDQRQRIACLDCQGRRDFERNGLDAQLVYFTGGTTAVMALISADTVLLFSWAGGGQLGSRRVGCHIDRRWHYSFQLLLIVPPRDQNTGATQGIGHQSLWLIGCCCALCLGQDWIGAGKMSHRADRRYHRSGGRYTNRTSTSNGPGSLCQYPRAETRYESWLIFPSLDWFTSNGTCDAKKYIREHSDVVRRYVKAQVEAVHRIYTDKEASIRALARFFGGRIERDVLEKTGKIFLSSGLPKSNIRRLRD